MKLFPDAAPVKGRWVVIKCDSGPGRLNPTLLAYLRFHGFILYPGVPNGIAIDHTFTRATAEGVAVDETTREYARGALGSEYHTIDTSGRPVGPQDQDRLGGGLLLHEQINIRRHTIRDLQ